MHRIDHSTLYLARLVLEADSALSVSTGNPDGVFDSALVRDANGLPALPGTSVAGVLRHLWIDTWGGGDEASAGALFGDEGASSRLTVSWGALLDSRGRPAEGLLLGEQAKRLEQDELFKAVLDQADTPVLRDRVRLTHRGAAADTGKFDRSVLPAGHRFALEVRLWAPADDDGEDWRRLLSLFRHPAFRLGGGTRAGLGKMKLVSLHEGRFDLRRADAVRRFQSLPPGLTETGSLQKVEVSAPQTDRFVTANLILKARGLWRIGQGNESLTDGAKVPDLLPKTEERIVWQKKEDQEAERGQRQLRLLLFPASSLKGALAHRMAFHARRFSGQWNDGELPDERPAAIDALLGSIKDSNEKEDADKGKAGALFIDDAWLTIDAVSITRLMHNAIDRFTGGVRDRMLFEEESLLGGELKISLTLDTGWIDEQHRDIARRAFRAALEDLCAGRLAVGSKTTTGNGFFEGKIEGALGTWLNQETKEAAA